MLSLTRCRKLLGTGSLLSDEQVIELRDQLAAIAQLALDLFGPAALDAIGERAMSDSAERDDG